MIIAAIAGGLLILPGLTLIIHSDKKRRGKAETPEWLRLRWTATLSFAAILIAFEISCFSLQTIKEPFAWIEGVSVWPSAILRTLAAILAASSLAWLHRQIEKNDDELGHLFFLGAAPIDTIQDSPRRWYQWLSRLPVSPLPEATHLSVSKVWQIYQVNGKPAQRWKRVAVMSGLYLAASSILFRVFGQPHVPYRGNGSWWAVSLPLFAGVLCQMILTFFVVDATCLCRILVKQLSHHQNNWPAQAAERWGIPVNAADEVLAVDLIARRTKLIGKMILYPFAVLFLIILSRNLYFDRWDWPISLFLVYSTNSLIAFCCAIALWLSGKKVLQWGLDGLQKKLIRAEGEGNDKLAKQLTLLIEEVRSTREGAFASLSEQPLFVALFLPFGGIGAASLLDLLANAF
jgi:hypothetical protein